jgi:hypothetical protein
LPVKPREIINLRNEKIRLLYPPLLQGRHGPNMTECPLWQVVMIDVDLALERFRQVCPRATAAGRQDRADADVAARDQAVGLGMARWDEAVLAVLCVADPITAMLDHTLFLHGSSNCS